MRFVVLALVLLLSSPALAQQRAIPVQSEVRTIDFTTVLHNVDGKPMVRTPDLPQTTLGDFVALALMSTIQAEQPAPTPPEKAARFKLAVKVQDSEATKVALTSEDVTRIKNVSGLYFGPLIMGQIWKIVDPASMQ